MRWTNPRVMQTYFITIFSPGAVELSEHLRWRLLLILKQLISVHFLSDFRNWKILNNPLESVQSNTRLHIISSIQTV